MEPKGVLFQLTLERRSPISPPLENRSMAFIWSELALAVTVCLLSSKSSW